MSSPAGGIRARLAAGGRHIKRLERIDRAAGLLITFGGMAIVASVFGILLFIVLEALPLFLPAEGRLASRIPAAGARPLVFGVDEYQRYAWLARADGRLELRRLADGSLARELPLAGLEGATLTAGARTSDGHELALGTADGRAAFYSLRFSPRYEGSRLADLDVELEPRGVAVLDAAGRAVKQLGYAADADSGEQVAAAVVGDNDLRLWRSSQAPETAVAALDAGGEPVTALRLGGQRRLAVGTAQGHVYHWQLDEEPQLTSVSPIGAQPVTALEWVVGAGTFVAGDAAGSLSAWFGARLDEDDTVEHTVRAHDLNPLGGPVAALAASPRDRVVAALARDGRVVLHYVTSEREVLSLPAAGGEAAGLVLTPKGDGVLVALADGSLARYTVQAPHPEVTLRALFGRVWYEGYAAATWVWQSTGATSDFEPKLSLTPLAFGTMKATAYALLFAIPLAVLGALYTSQFVHPDVRGRIKPTVEIMAALPSVVIGFLAGLWLAPMIERLLPGVLAMPLLLPLFGLLGGGAWRLLPRSWERRLKPGSELLLVVPLLALAGWLSLQLGPWLEAAFFRGDLKAWLLDEWGLTYDQRNSLVVGIAMGFAVIPIIFTIADDAFASVPGSLSAASLALGASRWQTALRVVLPTASPGVFSAVMVGFGRAVGETMIVLMASGNTPVLDWSIFNGMRPLSANVAVEIPEAPHGSTLYRVLFLAAGLLFLMTFVVNTVAEVIRQRLRERYRAV